VLSTPEPSLCQRGFEIGHPSLVATWVGVDVGGKRKGFDVAVIDDRRVLTLEGGLGCGEAVELIEGARPAVVAIDSPCCCAPEGHTSRDGERLLAKSICGIRWTPEERAVRANPYYEWIVEGLALFTALAAHRVEVIEVFPTASWTRWCGRRGSRSRAAWSSGGLASLGLAGLPAGTNQDQRDAIAAAVTARQHTEGATETLGTIVVPAGRMTVSPGLRETVEAARVVVRGASQSDLDALLSLYRELAGDQATAAPGDRHSSESLLARILADPRRELAVAVVDGEVVGTADLLVVANLTYHGDPWAIVENVIVASTARRMGVGRALMKHLIELARAAGCCRLQLISGRHRSEAHELYRGMGLSAVAEGFKIYFDE
jgi:predicted nuclease with RNAse H fold/GNAT superfamily N-acetyltransferase